MNREIDAFGTIAALLFLAATLLPGSVASAAEKSPRDTGGKARGPGAAPAFSHAPWDGLLKKYVNDAGRVDYAGLRRNDAATLKKYLDDLARADIGSIRDERELKAFWTNAYNAICVQTLLDHGLPSPVPHSNVPVFGTNIFTERTYKVAGKVRSLDDIEHGIIRKMYRDSRLHAALVCGARSCPRLRPEAYTGEKIEGQLEEECVSWFQKETSDGKERKNRLDRKGRVYHVSKIFDWFQEDFRGNTAGVLEFLKKYSSAEDREFLEKNRVEIQYLAYDWTLNSQP
ncbi:MAG: DUF547 domain-containing protein [Planctomycetota bacterium]